MSIKDDFNRMIARRTADAAQRRNAHVAERQEVSIVLLPTATRPAKNEPWEQCAALLLNPCDGFHLVYAYFDGDGEFDRFSDFASSEPYADDFYVAWALLPDELPLIHYFDPKRRPAGVEGRKP